MKFCTNCGNQLGNEKFCTKCGTPTGIAQQQWADDFAMYNRKPQPVGNIKKGKGRLILTIVLAVVIIAVGILAGLIATKTIDVGEIYNSVFQKDTVKNSESGEDGNSADAEENIAEVSGRSYEELINECFDATLYGHGTSEQLLSFTPEAVIDYVVQDDYSGDKDSYIEEIDRQLSTMSELYATTEVDESFISYKIINTYDLDDISIQEAMEKYPGVELDIKEAKNIEIEFTVSATGYEESMSEELTVVKIGKTWYLLDPVV